MFLESPQLQHLMWVVLSGLGNTGISHRRRVYQRINDVALDKPRLLHGGDFEEYAERLPFYFLANDVGKLCSSPSPVEKLAAEGENAAVLISLLSGTVYSTLKSQCLPNTPATKGFDELITLLNDDYKPEVYSVTATYQFNQCRQESEESVKDFINRLKRAAVKFDFGSHLDRALREQFLARLSDGATRKEILAKPAADIRTFQEVDKIATEWETAVKAAAQLASSSIVVLSSSSVNALSRKQSVRMVDFGAKSGCRDNRSSHTMRWNGVDEEEAQSWCVLFDETRRRGFIGSPI